MYYTGLAALAPASYREYNRPSAASRLTRSEEPCMQPEWSGDPEFRPMVVLIAITGLIAFLLLVWVFAFYW